MKRRIANDCIRREITYTTKEKKTDREEGLTASPKEKKERRESGREERDWVGSLEF